MEATANANGSKYIYKTHTKNTQTHTFGSALFWGGR